MNKIFTLFFFILLVSACSTVRHAPSVTDSTRVEVRVEREFVHDTAWLELPVIIEKVATLDTASVLENKYAKSEAFVSGGVLTHSLQTKSVKEPVSIQHEIVYRDSLVYRDRVQTQTVEVERQLTAWQRLRLSLGSVFLVLIVVATLYLSFKLFNLIS